MEYMFIRAKKNVITEKNDGMKNSKEKRKKKIKSKEIAFWRGSNGYVYSFQKMLTVKKYWRKYIS